MSIAQCSKDTIKVVSGKRSVSLTGPIHTMIQLVFGGKSGTDLLGITVATQARVQRLTHTLRRTTKEAYSRPFTSDPVHRIVSPATGGRARSTVVRPARAVIGLSDLTTGLKRWWNGGTLGLRRSIVNIHCVRTHTVDSGRWRDLNCGEVPPEGDRKVHPRVDAIHSGRGQDA